jgi:hypothetical protein
MDPLQQDWTEIRLKVDLRNLTGPSEAGRVEEDTLRTRLSEANRIWSQCAIRFNPLPMTPFTSGIITL